MNHQKIDLEGRNAPLFFAEYEYFSHLHHLAAELISSPD
jgi:hypothetical protein